MADYVVNSENKRQKLDGKLDNDVHGLIMLNSEYEDAFEFYQKAATSYQLTKAWDQAGSTYVKLAECHLKVDSKDEAAAAAYVDAANCYKKISPIQAISCLEQAVKYFSDIGRFSMAAQYCKEVGEIYENLRNFEEAIIFFKRAATFFQGEAETAFASQCKHKVALFSAILKQYEKAIKIFEEVATEAVNSDLLRYGVRGHLLNAGLCHLCEQNIVEVTDVLERYQNIDPTFSRTREYELLRDLITACKEKDVEKFTEVLREYDSLSPLDSWKTILLLRIKSDLKAKEMRI